MNRRQSIRVAIGLLLAFLQTLGRGKEEFVVIVNSSNQFDSLSRTKVSYVFLRKVSRWPWGAEAAPANLPTSEPTRQEFLQQVLRMNEGLLAEYWIDQRATRGISPPTEVRDPAAVKLWVAARPGGIGYIPASALDGTVKALRVDP
jgi:hypothetical protein